MSIRATAAALSARLSSDSVLAGSTFQGVVTQRPNRYVTFFLNGGPRTANRFTGPSNVVDWTVTVHSVGTTAEQAQLVDERVQAQFVDWVPAVPGFACRRMVFVSSQPVAYDTDVTPPLYYLASQYSITAERLSA